MQTYLNFQGIEVDMISSNNHASPTGALPFVTPLKDPTKPIPANRIRKWAMSQSGTASGEDPEWTPRHEAFQSLIDLPIRRAWLYHLYVLKANIKVVKNLYIYPSSSNPLVQNFSLYQLQQAAMDELKKTHNVISETGLYAEAEKAFEALSTLLGDNDWLFEGKQPSLLDASLFAYTHLILADSMGWQDMRLAKILRRSSNLMRHRDRILELYFDYSKRETPST